MRVPGILLRPAPLRLPPWLRLLPTRHPSTLDYLNSNILSNLHCRPQQRILRLSIVPVGQIQRADSGRGPARWVLTKYGLPMLIEKEIIAPGTYWYTDETSGLPRKLNVTPELTKYWHEQGGKMLGAGLTIPVPFEHDFSAHPMTPKDKLLNNAGWVKEYRLKEGGKLFGVVDVQDEDIARKLPRTIRWTSPWINSFTDGTGHQWNNVISHLALTTRPRITQQAPFGSIAAALSIATETTIDNHSGAARDGFCLSRAGRLVTRKKDKRLCPRYPIAFSMWAGGIRLGEEDMMPPMKKKSKPSPGAEGKGKGEGVGGNSEDEGDGIDDFEDEEGGADDEMGGLMNPMQDSGGDVEMEELLCDLLNALGVPMPEQSSEAEFKRHLYEAAMMKIKELTSKGMAAGEKSDQKPPDASKVTSSPAGGAGQNPLIRQEQQPMYMALSIEDIQKISDPTMRTIALSMFQDNQRLRTEMEASKKVSDGLRDAKLKEAAALRQQRVTILGKVSPRAKADLDAMLAMPSMALSMGDGGAVVDPMAHTLAVLEKGLADMPRLLTAEASALSVQPHPTDGDGQMSDERANEIVDSFSRMMGAPPEKRAS